MRPIRFEIATHYLPMVEQLKAREAYIPSPKELPKIGYAIFKNETIQVASGFLRKVEGGYAQIDSVCTNPACSSEDRHEALELLVKTLLHKAKMSKINNVLFLTVDESTIVRSQNHGFKKLPQTVMAVDLIK